MIKTIKRGAKTTLRRGQGRPVSGKNDVGRERILAATEKLLRALPPARVTLSLVARECKVDPALVRYYFGSRTALFVAVVDRASGYTQHRHQQIDEPVFALAEHIRKTLQFVNSNTFMHRLMIDELMQAGSAESRARVKAMNLDLIDFYRELLRLDSGKDLVATNPLFLHLAVLGASDFFSSAEPLIRELAPKGTDMRQLAAGFQSFLVKLVLDGLRKR